jgi:hypothetical protein
MAEREYLLMVAEPTKELHRSLAQLHAGTKQEFSPRVLVVGFDQGPAKLRSLPKVTVVVSSDEPEAVNPHLDVLSVSERLQVEAWRDRNLGLHDDAKTPGDGLPWDAPGFEAPDPEWARHV